ncbi:alkyl sulfatase dimerization domain-containing protein [Variovorax sp. J22R133]|uniref:alkyl sulfatase dimerization domain-containing protein n=1 Tax=Variovorax brevis TaxID=3053503 RepID=UPI002577A4A4|nr:alkyl sulfatase dimerization domain-containing protein [Variovorax sp. J22R133]MDM0114803.1 alkyl sulfatase dimerization domain-containing protein [Variovorax sp. J22R133]
MNTTLSPYMGGPVDVVTGKRGDVANASFARHAAQFERKVHTVAKGVWCHVGSCLGNSTMIEGKTGTIVIDTGDCIEQSVTQKADFAAVCSKPLAALVYTHSHYAFGSRTWVPVEMEGKVPVWAHPDLLVNLSRNVGDLSPFIMRRIAIQFGLHLPPEGPDSMAHHGLGPFFYELDKYKPTPGFVRPTHQATDGLKTEIDGVKFEFFDCWGDTDDTLLIWLPESRTVINNIAWPAMFNIYTLRGEVFRNPIELLRGLDKILELQPEHLIGVHGVPISGREAVAQAITEYRDTIQYIYDQTVRGINAGLSPDELANTIELPESLRNGRLTQQHYGEMSYHVRQVYSGMVGWFGKDTVELHPVAEPEEARRVVALAGGEDKFFTAAQASMDQKEYAWAAQMATWGLRNGGARAAGFRQLKADALRAMARATTAANTRSWYLTQARELEGLCDTNVTPVTLLNPTMVKQMPPRTYVNGLRFKLPATLSANGAKVLHLHFTQPELDFTLLLRNGVVVVKDGAPANGTNADATLDMSFDTWARLVGREATGAALVASADIQASGDEALVAAVLKG